MFELVRSAMVSLALVLVSACGSSPQGNGTDTSRVIREIAERIGCTGLDVREGLPDEFSGICSTKPHGKMLIVAFANDSDRDEYVQENENAEDGRVRLELIEKGTSWAVYDLSSEDDKPMKDEPTDPKIVARGSVPDGWVRVEGTGYEYAIPRNWHLLENASVNSTTTDTRAADATDIESSNQAVITARVPTTIDADTDVDTALDELLEFFKSRGIEVTSSSADRLNGEDVLTFQYQTELAGVENSHWQYMFIRRGVMLQCTHSPDDTAALVTCVKIQNTLKFN